MSAFIIYNILYPHTAFNHEIPDNDLDQFGKLNQKEYRGNGTCSVTNYFVLQSLLNFNIPVDVYCFLAPKATLNIFGENVMISESPAKYIEGIFLAQANADFGNKLPGCFQD